MTLESVPSINRSVLIPRPKQPMVDWLRSLPDPTDISLEEINEECTSYLVRDYNYQGERAEVIREVYQTVFEIELESWWLDRSDWPDTTDFDTFNRWFDVQLNSVTFDLADRPLRRKG